MSDNDDEELREELASGHTAARELVEHMIRMGAGSLQIPILVNDETFLVTVSHKPVTL